MSADHDTGGEISALIRQSAASYVAAEDTLGRARHARHASGVVDAAAWAQLAAPGFAGMLAPEAAGGGGMGLVEAAALHEELGRGLAPEPLALAAHLPILAARRATGPGAAALLAALAEGEGPCPLAWQGKAGALSAEDTRVRAEGGPAAMVLRGEARFVPATEGATAILVAARAPEGVGLYRIAPDAPGLKRAVERTADGGTSATLVFDNVAVAPADVVALPGEGGRAADAALDETRVILSAELLGVMREALARTLDYLRTRKQFGRTIGSFQALQHRAVDLHVQVELAAAALAHALDALADSDDDAVRALAASGAKARAGDAASLVTREAIQLHGAIAYTDEHDAGLFLNRALMLGAALGNAGVHRRRYGLLAARHLAA